MQAYAANPRGEQVVFESPLDHAPARAAVGREAVHDVHHRPRPGPRPCCCRPRKRNVWGDDGGLKAAERGAGLCKIK